MAKPHENDAKLLRKYVGYTSQYAEMLQAVTTLIIE
jgi:hypothetical protein